MPQSIDPPPWQLFHPIIISPSHNQFRQIFPPLRTWIRECTDAHKISLLCRIKTKGPLTPSCIQVRPEINQGPVTSPCDTYAPCGAYLTVHLCHSTGVTFRNQRSREGEGECLKTRNHQCGIWCLLIYFMFKRYIYLWSHGSNIIVLYPISGKREV